MASISFELYSSIHELYSFAENIAKFSESIRLVPLNKSLIQKINGFMIDIENTILHLPESLENSADPRYVQLYQDTIELLYHCHKMLESKLLGVTR